MDLDNKDRSNTDSYSESKTYYYSVSSEPENAKKKKNSKGKKAAALAILIVVCMFFSSIVTSMMFTVIYGDFWNGNRYIPTGTQNGGFQNGTVNTPLTQSPSGVDDTIIINKNETDENKELGGTVGDKDLTVAQVTALVADSVVEITTSSVKYNFYYGQYVESGAGSGVIVGRSQTDARVYYVVTNHHVIDGAEKIYITLRDGAKLDGKLIGTDMVSDIALVQITSGNELTVADLGNGRNSVVGEEVVVIGNPLGQLGGTVTNGIISALERSVNIGGMNMTLMQTNAAISPGNSGGGMFNMSGELIGVINAKYSDSSAEGLGFAIPIDYVYSIMTDLLKQGYVSGRAGLPFEYQEYTTTSIMGTSSSYLFVTTEDAELGIQINDMIYSVDGNQITTHSSLLAVLSGYEVGDEIELKVARTSGRNSKLYTYTVKLVESIPVKSS